MPKDVVYSAVGRVQPSFLLGSSVDLYRRYGTVIEDSNTVLLLDGRALNDAVARGSGVLDANPSQFYAAGWLPKSGLPLNLSPFTEILK